MKKTASYEAALFSQRFKNYIYEEVIKAVEQSAEECGMTRATIAKNLGYSKPHISRLLSGPSNWTLDTISNLLFAIDAEMIGKVRFFKDCPKQNHFHEMGEPISATIMPKSLELRPVTIEKMPDPKSYRSHSTPIVRKQNSYA